MSCVSITGMLRLISVTAFVIKTTPRLPSIFTFIRVRHFSETCELSWMSSVMTVEWRYMTSLLIFPISFPSPSHTHICIHMHGAAKTAVLTDPLFMWISQKCTYVRGFKCIFIIPNSFCKHTFCATDFALALLSMKKLVTVRCIPRISTRTFLYSYLVLPWHVEGHCR
jgi:hypothetical protein